MTVAPDDPVVRLEKADTALHDMILANETALRMMLTYSLQRGIDGGRDNRLPAGRNRRSPLIEAAPAPSRSRFRPSVLKNPGRSLALIIGTEAIKAALKAGPGA